MKKKLAFQRVEVDKTFEEVFEDFQLNNRARGLSENTVKFYSNNLPLLKNYLEKVGITDISSITKDNFQQFVLWLRDSYENKTTINTYLRAARTFLYYAMAEDCLPSFKITIKQPEKKVKETYTDEEIKKLLQRPNLKTCPFTEYRNWVMIQYLLDTGNRLNTVRYLKVADVYLKDGMVVIKTVKNNRQQFSPISKPLIKSINDFIRTWGLQPEDYLFPGVDRQQLTKDGMQKTVARYNRSRSVERTSIHAFRHTFAKNYVTSGGNAFKLQRLLGHSTLEVTQDYVALFSQDLAEGFEKHSLIEKYNPSGKRLQRS